MQILLRILFALKFKILRSPNQKRMQPHVVLNGFQNAPSYDPFQVVECRLIQSESLFGVQAYVAFSDNCVFSDNCSPLITASQV